MFGIDDAIVGAIAGSMITGLFSSASAKQQMAFQSDMSNTAYQRAVQDMKAAGINPMLAAKVGGASTPGGASYSIPDLGSTASSAISAVRAREETKNVRTQGEILLRDKANADLDLAMLQKYPQIRLAEKLRDVSPANLAAATALWKMQETRDANSSSAKSYAAEVKNNKWSGKPIYPEGHQGVYPPPIKEKTSPKKEHEYYKFDQISPQEMLEINKQIRDQFYRERERSGK